MESEAPEPGLYQVTQTDEGAEKVPQDSSGDSENKGAGRTILQALAFSALLLLVGLLGLVQVFGWGGLAAAVALVVGLLVLAKMTIGKQKRGRGRATRGGSRKSGTGGSKWRPGGAGGGGRWGSGPARKTAGLAAGRGRASRLGLGQGKRKAARGSSKATKPGGRGSATRGGSAATQKGRLRQRLPFGRGSGRGSLLGGRQKRGGVSLIKGKPGGTASGRGRLGRFLPFGRGTASAEGGKPKKRKRLTSPRLIGMALTAPFWVPALPFMAWRAFRNWRLRRKSEAGEGKEGSSEDKPTWSQRMAGRLLELYQRAELKSRGKGAQLVDLARNIRAGLWEKKEGDRGESAFPSNPDNPIAEALGAPEGWTLPKLDSRRSDLLPWNDPAQLAALLRGDHPDNPGYLERSAEAIRLLADSNYSRGERAMLSDVPEPDSMLEYQRLLESEAIGVEEACARASYFRDMAETDLPVEDAFRTVFGEYAAAWELVAEMGAELVAEFNTSHEHDINRLLDQRPGEPMWDVDNNDV